MRYLCQLDYPNVPYPGPTHPNDCIDTSGCGVCCACMIVENLLGIPFPVEECAAFARQSGARDRFGTDMVLLADALSRRFPLDWTGTDDAESALSFLHARTGMVIANPQGDREGHVGLFTRSGHYIVIAEACRRTVLVLDPSLQPDKFERDGRRGQVFVSGTNVYCDMEAITEDGIRSPMFYLFLRRC